MDIIKNLHQIFLNTASDEIIKKYSKKLIGISVHNALYYRLAPIAKFIVNYKNT